MNTQIDSTNLALGLVFGAIGLGYFIYGKRQKNALVRYSGVALMVFPYFVESNLATLAIGCLLMFAPKLLERFS